MLLLDSRVTFGPRVTTHKNNATKVILKMSVNVLAITVVEVHNIRA